MQNGIKTTSLPQYKVCLRSGKLFVHIKGKNHSGVAKLGKSLYEDSEL